MTRVEFWNMYKSVLYEIEYSASRLYESENFDWIHKNVEGEFKVQYWPVKATLDFQRKMIVLLLKKQIINSEGKKDQKIAGAGPSKEIDSFENYLRKPINEKLISYLITEYSNPKPKKNIAYMLLALEDFGHLKNHIHSFHQENLLLALKETLGDIGSRQNLFHYLGNLESPTIQEKDLLKRHKERLKDAIELDKP